MAVGGLQRVAVPCWVTILTLVTSYAQVCGITCRVVRCADPATQEKPAECPAHAGSQPSAPADSDSDCVRHGHRNSFLQAANPSLDAGGVIAEIPAAHPSVLAEKLAATARWMQIQSHSPPNQLPLYLSIASLRI